jgi:hypothetical protein
MPLNIGYVGSALDDGVVSARVYYDTAWLNADPTRDQMLAPLVNGPRGWCLDLTNLTGRNAKVVMSLPSGMTTTVTMGQGDPVTTGPANGRSRTAADLAALGYTTRGDVTGLSLAYA